MVESTCTSNICIIHFFHPHFIIKTIVFHFPEKLVALHHTGFTIAMFEVNEFTIAKFLHPVGHVSQA